MGMLRHGQIGEATTAFVGWIFVYRLSSVDRRSWTPIHRRDHDRHRPGGGALPTGVRPRLGATPEGKKELIGLIDGVRESTQSWKELLLDLKRRGLSMGPELAVADGALGFWQAIEEVWPKTRGQRCWVHKTANVLNKLGDSMSRKAFSARVSKV